MAYSQEVFLKANEILNKRREDAYIKAEQKAKQVAEKIPELEAIQTGLAQIGLSISKVFLYSNDKEGDIKRLSEESLKLQKSKEKLLVKNGFDKDALKVNYNCPFCEDSGRYNEKMCRCHKELLKDIERANLQKIAPLKESTFESFDTNYYPEEISNGVSPRIKAEKIKEQCNKYAATFNLKSPSLFLQGGTGIGKTHLSLAIANVVINRGFSVTYGTAQNILGDIESEHFGRNRQVDYDERSVLFSDLLIIDDLGTEFATSFTISAIYNIVNTRMLAGRPTIISTNLNFDELEAKYDQRITSRISGYYSTLILEGNDIRYMK